MERVCADCGATAPGMFPAGWEIEPVYSFDVSGQRYVCGERPRCLDCLHPELRAPDCEERL
jgi:hypothetical protein